MSKSSLIILALFLGFLSGCTLNVEDKKNSITSDTVRSPTPRTSPTEPPRAINEKMTDVTDYSSCHGRPDPSLTLYNTWKTSSQSDKGLRQDTSLRFSTTHLIVRRVCNRNGATAIAEASIPIIVSGNTIEYTQSANDQQQANWGDATVHCEVSINAEVVSYNLVGKCLELVTRDSRRNRLPLAN